MQPILEIIRQLGEEALSHHQGVAKKVATNCALIYGDLNGVVSCGGDRRGALPLSKGKRVLFPREKQQFPIDGRPPG